MREPLSVVSESEALAFEFYHRCCNRGELHCRDQVGEDMAAGFFQGEFLSHAAANLVQAGYFFQAFVQPASGVCGFLGRAPADILGLVHFYGHGDSWFLSISSICDSTRLRPGHGQQGCRDEIGESIIFPVIVIWLKMVYIQILINIPANRC